MKTASRRTGSVRVWSALGCAAVVALLAWLAPASADAALGGYETAATAQVVRVQLYDSGLPIPVNSGEAEVDGGVAYTTSSATTGPTTSAKASYLWPGDAVGSGFGDFVGNPNATYPVQVNSTFPASPSAPAHDTVQLSNGNGMTTAADGKTTSGDVTLAGVSGPDPTGGLLSGLGALSGKTQSPAPTATPPLLPTNIGKNLAGLVTAKNITSNSTVTVGSASVTSSAHAAVGNLSLLDGIISLQGVDVSAVTTSDGKKATATGHATFGGLTILGQKIAINAQGIDLANSFLPLPALSPTINSVLKILGISITATPSKSTVTGASGTLSAQALTVTIDTTPFQSLLNLIPQLLSSPLTGDLLSKLGPLQSILSVAPKVVLTVGNVDSSAVASPPFPTGGSGPVASAPTTAAGGTGGSVGSTGTTSGAGFSGGGTGGGGAITGGGGGAVTNPPPATTQPASMQPTALDLPPLATVPRLLILGALVFAAILGWFLRTAGAALLGGAGRCDFGLDTGVPDLRKG